MESDRELLELAAKAAGVEGIKFHTECGCFVVKERRWWNPIADDGDALRLAVKRNVFFNPLFVHYLAVERFANQDADDTKAYRRAIVRTVAAEIGTVAVEIGRGN